MKIFFLIMTVSLLGCTHMKSDKPKEEARCEEKPGTLVVTGNQVLVCDGYAGTVLSAPDDDTYWQVKVTCSDPNYPPKISPNKNEGSCVSAEGDVRGTFAFCDADQIGKWFEASFQSDGRYFYFLCATDFGIRGVPHYGFENQNIQYTPFHYCKKAERATMPTDRSVPLCGDGKPVGKVLE